MDILTRIGSLVGRLFPLLPTPNAMELDIDESHPAFITGMDDYDMKAPCPYVAGSESAQLWQAGRLEAWSLSKI